MSTGRRAARSSHVARYALPQSDTGSHARAVGAMPVRRQTQGSTSPTESALLLANTRNRVLADAALTIGWKRQSTAMSIWLRPARSQASRLRELRCWFVAIPALLIRLPLTPDCRTMSEARAAGKAGPPAHNEAAPAARQCGGRYEDQLGRLLGRHRDGASDDWPGESFRGKALADGLDSMSHHPVCRTTRAIPSAKAVKLASCSLAVAAPAAKEAPPVLAEKLRQRRP